MNRDRFNNPAGAAKQQKGEMAKKTESARKKKAAAEKSPTTKKPVAKKKPVAEKKPTAKRRRAAKKSDPAAATKKSAAESVVAEERPRPKAVPPTSGAGFPIVGIGASAGGLETLETLFKAMPPNAGMAFVVVVHLDPTHVSLLPELLQNHTRMPVAQIVDGTRVKPNHVYVIPPNRDVTILHGTLNLLELVRPRGTNLPIDTFFRSLAQDQGRNASGIILSGTGTDGTLGVKAIKGEVGMVMVQDEQTAKYGGMPRSAIATGLVDYVLAPDKMPEQLIKYMQHVRHKAAARLDPDEGPLPASLQKIFVILRARTGHDFSLYKKNTICRRVERRMNVHQIDDVSEYVRYLQESDREAGILFKELLIGVTNFFRDPEAFQILRDEALPELLETKPDDYAVRVWVPGCASGEEAYSVAILLHECMERIGRHFHVQVFGTDIDEDAIAVARSGVYPASIIADVEPARLKRYFIKDDQGQYRVKKLIREMLVFAPQNVIKDPPFTKLDLLCCRNLLIYLGAELQQRLLPVFHYSLKPDGLLFLGSSETVGTSSDLFVTANKKWRLFRRKQGSQSGHPVLHFPAQARTYQARDLEVPEAVQRAEELSALQLVETILHQSDTPPCVIINDAGNVVYIHGRTGKFLEPAQGKASVNILGMARAGLRTELAAAIRQVAASKEERIARGLRVDYDGDEVLVDLTVAPILEQTAMRGLMMVGFEETATHSKPKATETKRTRARSRLKSVDDLEQELRHTKESLRTTIEELETSKEELQSLNEESATVNAELQSRIEELSKSTDDMKNLLDSTEIATLFLDTELRVRRFTPRVTTILPLAATDLGRPVSDLASALRDVDLSEWSQLVLDDLVVRQTEVEGGSEHWYFMRIRPYRTIANVIDGVVITFEDITERRQAQEELRRAEEKSTALLEASPVCTQIIDLDSRLQYMSRAGVEQLKITGIEAYYGAPYPPDFFAESMRRPLIEHLERAKLGEVCSLESPVRDLKGGEVWYHSTFVPLRGETGGIDSVVVTSVDITERKRVDQALADNERRRP